MRTDWAKTRSCLSPGRRAVVAGAIALTLALALSAGCTAPESEEETSGDREYLLGLQTPTSVWWTGDGEYAVLQTIGEDGTPVVTAWNRETKKTRSYPHYRVVDVERHEPRFWVVPDERVIPWSLHDKGEPHVIDIAGDGIDSRPDELFVVELDGSAKPRADVDARYRAWVGPAHYSASVEIDVNKGACPGTLRFHAVGSSLNAWSAKVPTDVVTFEPVGWSPSGAYFAVISQADASATASAIAAWTKAYDANVELAKKTSSAAGNAPTDIEAPPPPTFTAAILVFAAADGSLAARQDVEVPILEPNAGANLAAWSAGEDVEVLSWFQQSDGVPEMSALAPLAMIEPVDPRSSRSSQPPRFAWFAGTEDDALLYVEKWNGPEWAGMRLSSIGVSPANVLDMVELAGGDVTARWSPYAGMLSVGSLNAGPGTTVYLSSTPEGTPKKAFSVAGPKK